ncbi:MAG TPA: ABC transporter permease [Gaiellaceae bacterium]|jgi:ABC-2 type transport system permease protein|nr:ABC transporter permease [Gaiellaceae bacterium]
MTAAARGRLFLVLHQARYDMLGILRNRQARFFTLVLPLLFLIIFVGVFGDHVVGPGRTKASAYYVPGLAALGVIAASFVNLVITITAQRETGILKRRRATPMPAWALIAGRTLTAVTVSIVVLTVLLSFGRFVYHVKVPTSTLPGIALTAVVGSITFCVLGYALSTAIKNEDAAQPMVQAIMLPLYFISGVFVPNIQLPSWLRHVAQVFPVEHLSDGLHKAYAAHVHGVGIVWSDIGVLALWAAVGLTIALVRFSWLPQAAGA